MPRLIRIKPETTAFTRQPDAPPTATQRATPDASTHASTHASPHATVHASPHVPGPRHVRAQSAEAPPRAPLSIRSAERRRWSADLTGPDLTGLVLHGLGGIGKSTLAAQIAARVCRLQPWRVVTVVTGETSPHSLPVYPTEADLLVLDNFDDNLSAPDGSTADGTAGSRVGAMADSTAGARADRTADTRADTRTVRDPALAALLANWRGKLLITCREPFGLPAPGGDRLGFRHVGPLTRSGAAELAVAMPALRNLSEPARDRAWRLAAGHPRTMEYLDALLATGNSLDEIAALLARPEPAAPTELPTSAAESIAQAVGDRLLDELFDRLGAGAQALLVRASVFRAPVGPVALAARPSHVADARAAGLLTVGPGRELWMHRWTADGLHRRLAGAGQRDQVAAAHRGAAEYWRSRAADTPSGQRAILEAGYHLHAVGEAARPRSRQSHKQPPPAGRHRLQRHRLRWLGVGAAAAALAALAASEAASGSAAPRPTQSASPAQARLASSSAAAAAAEVRNQAAAWVARQVSAGVILACDPAMCAALVAQGVPAGNLLVLGPGVGDPLGSAIVLATPAVRATFGSRLASVYAPEILASFGTGAARVEVRVVAPDGTVAYLRALGADRRARQLAAAQLVRNPSVSLTASARAELAAGRVDTRLLLTLATLAASEPLDIIGFSGAGPGASPDLPLRAAEFRPAPGTAARALAFVRAQRPPYLAAHAALAPGGALTIEFAAPSPLGLLQSPP